MIVFPNIKINLGLNIISKREDGYHNIASCFYPIPWKDVLEIIPAKEDSIHLTGLPVAGSKENNLCFKALHLLRRDFSIPPVAIHLHKILPSGAGLGGGSSDGAHTLLVLNILFDLQIQEDKLIEYAKQLGADCPFFIKNTPQFVTGIGEIMQPCSLRLTGMHFYLLHPPIHVSTAEAFSGIIPNGKTETLQKALQEEQIVNWPKVVKNDFESTIFPQHPEIESIKQLFYNKGAVYSSMSGTGSAVYGLFKNEMKLPTEDAYTQFHCILP